LIEDAPGVLDLVEQNGRLEAIAVGGGSVANDAIYLSNGPSGFRLPTDADFSISIDYSFTGFDGSGTTLGDSMNLVFGVGRDLDGTDSAAISYGEANLLGHNVALAEVRRIDDNQSVNLLGTGTSTGTFVVSYDAAGDDLTLGDGTLGYVLEDTVRGVWNADELYVSLGVRGGGYVLDSGDAVLDNFGVVPEPAAWALIFSAALATLLLRRR
jgi:hypothetical protein